MSHCPLPCQGRLPGAALVGAIAFLLTPQIGLAARKPAQSIGGGSSHAAPNVTAVIGGSIYTGANDGTNMGGAIYAPDPAVPPILDAQVRIEDDEGDFVAYATPTGNTWSATVPAPGEYVVLFSAPNHDLTSRRFVVNPGDNLAQDAYLPSLPLPLANLLVFCFEDWIVNGEPDAAFEDPPLDGVILNLIDEEGNVVQTGVTGTGLDQNGLPTAGRGLYYFTGFPAGEYHVSADPTTIPGRPDWHWTYTEEGTRMWELPLYPGDPGTEAGGFLIWFGFVEKYGQIPNSQVPVAPPDGGYISGTLLDADGNDLAEPPPPPWEAPCVFANGAVPDAKVILYTDMDTPYPVATTLADPVTGFYEFFNVPPGPYKIFSQDMPLDYIWVPLAVNVAPNAVLTNQDILLPRFFARIQGYVYDGATDPPTPMVGAKVITSPKPHHAWKTELTDGTGWYNFDNLEEIEVMGFTRVVPPAGYRPMHVPPDTATAPPDSTFDTFCRRKLGREGNYYVQFYTANYRVDLYLEPIPAATGDIRGFTWYDHLAMGTWVGDGLYDEAEEPLIRGVPIRLWDASMTTLIDSTATGQWDAGPVLDQGWIPPYSVPADEWGGVFRGPNLGHYEFRDLAPGDYVVEVLTPAGYTPVDPTLIPVTVAGGAAQELSFGFTTPVPRSGEMEGGVWDDLNLDLDPMSQMYMEKAGIEGTPVVMYDHNFYQMDRFLMPDSYPPGAPEVEAHTAPGVHIYAGNDPNDPAFNPNYLPLILPYTFGQGKAKYEADWSLVPVAFLGLNGGMVGEWPIDPINRPVLSAPAAQTFLAPGDPKPGATVQILGSNFGDAKGSATITLSGVELPVSDWTDGAITVTLPDKALPGPIVVAGATGISNALPINIDFTDDPALEAYILSRSRFVDAANVGFEDGSQASPFNTIQEAIDNLPTVTPRYVFVAPGTYNERIVISQSDVEVVGSGPLETTIEGFGYADVPNQGVVGAGPVFEIQQGLENVRVSGFTITGGTGPDANGLGGGIFVSADCRNIEVSNNRIIRNGGTFGGGFWAHKSTHDITIHSNIIAENGTFEGYGGGISISDEPEEFSTPHGEPEHTWDDYFPGPPPGTIEIYNNVIFHNFSMDMGGGVCLYETKDQLVVHGNMFLENQSDDHGGGIFFEDCGPVQLFDNVFYRNYVPDDGGAVMFEDVADTLSHIAVWNNLVVENTADDRGENHARGGGFSFEDVRDAVVFNNTVSGNIVCGQYNPAGGALDAERHGDEYNGDTGPLMGLGYTDPAMFNNIFWGNWRVNYDLPVGLTGDEDWDYSWGSNFQWTPEELHVDNPALNSIWEMYLNSESFTTVENNDIRGGYSAGVNNVDVDPLFLNPANSNWRLSPGSPVIDQANALIGPPVDIEGLPRSEVGGMIDMGAFEWRSDPMSVVRLPTGILGAITPLTPPPGPLAPQGNAGVVDDSRRAQRHVTVRRVTTLGGSVAKEREQQESADTR